MTSREELLELLQRDGVVSPVRRTPPILLEGAEVYDLTEQQSGDVISFMGGLNRTRPVCFGREGLVTTASGDRSRLLISNELGTADIHMILLSVTAYEVELIYADVDERRVWFLRRLIGAHEVEWSRLDYRPSADEAADAAICEGYFLLRGRLPVSDVKTRRRVLGSIGAHLPFLVGWREAYQALRRFVGGDEVEATLECATAVEVGHAALLDNDGGALIAEAMKDVFGPDVWLPDLLGPVQTAEFLKDVLGVTWRARLHETPTAEVKRDIVDALNRHVLANTGSVARSFRDFTIVAVDGAFVLRDLLCAIRRNDSAAVDRCLRALQRYVSRGGQYLRQLHRHAGQNATSTVLVPVVSALNDARAALRDAAHGLSILRAETTPLGFIGDMQRLAELCVQTTQETVRMAMSRVRTNATESDDERQRRIDALGTVTDRARNLRHFLVTGLAKRPVETVGEVAVALEVVENVFRACEHFARAAQELYQLIGLSAESPVELGV